MKSGSYAHGGSAGCGYHDPTEIPILYPGGSSAAECWYKVSLPFQAVFTPQGSNTCPTGYSPASESQCEKAGVAAAAS